jgi:hypothetical protein
MVANGPVGAVGSLYRLLCASPCGECHGLEAFVFQTKE